MSLQLQIGVGFYLLQKLDLELPFVSESSTQSDRSTEMGGATVDIATRKYDVVALVNPYSHIHVLVDMGMSVWKHDAMPRSKVTTTVSIDPELRTLAKRYGVVMSQAAIAGIRSAVDEAANRQNAVGQADSAELTALLFEREEEDRNRENSNQDSQARIWAEGYARSWKDILYVAMLGLYDWEVARPAESVVISLGNWATSKTDLEPDELGYADIKYDDTGGLTGRVPAQKIYANMIEGPFLEAVLRLWRQIAPNVLDRIERHEVEAAAIAAIHTLQPKIELDESEVAWLRERLQAVEG